MEHPHLRTFPLSDFSHPATNTKLNVSLTQSLTVTLTLIILTLTVHFCVIPGPVVCAHPVFLRHTGVEKCLFASPALTVSASGTPVLLHFRVTLTTRTCSIVQYVPRYLLASYSLQCSYRESCDGIMKKCAVNDIISQLPN